MSGTAKTVVIKPGPNKSGTRDYLAETLRRDHGIFEGVKMFQNHQTVAQERERPEGDLNDWVGVLENVSADSDGTVRGSARIIDPKFKEKLGLLKKHGLLSQMGLSIRAIGEVEESQTTGIPRVTRLLKSRSVDFVTYPGAGGGVEDFRESAGDGDFSDLVGLVEAFEESAEFNPATQLACFRELDEAIAKSRRGPTFKGDERTVTEFRKAGFSREMSEVLAESADPTGELAKMARILEKLGG
jgi:hypothetical protein